MRQEAAVDSLVFTNRKSLITDRLPMAYNIVARI